MIHLLAVKSKAKQDAVLKSLFIKDMRFHNATVFTSFFCIYALEIPLLDSSFFFYIVEGYFVTLKH